MTDVGRPRRTRIRVINSNTFARLGLPVLTLPFAAAVAQRSVRALRIDWPGFTAFLASDGHQFAEAFEGAGLARETTVTLSWVDSVPPVTRLRQIGHRVTRNVWERLNRLAMLTTVPATARSHADAGASGSDLE